MMRRAEDDEDGAAAAEGSDEEEDVPRPVVAAYDRLSEAAAALAGADEGADDESLAPAGRLEPLEIADNAEFEADNADYIIHDWEEEVRDDDDAAGAPAARDAAEEGDDDDHTTLGEAETGAAGAVADPAAPAPPPPRERMARTNQCIKWSRPGGLGQKRHRKYGPNPHRDGPLAFNCHSILPAGAPSLANSKGGSLCVIDHPKSESGRGCHGAPSLSTSVTVPVTRTVSDGHRSG